MKKPSFEELKKIANGKDCIERTMLANALLIESIKRKPLSFGKCCAIFELIDNKNENH